MEQGPWQSMLKGAETDIGVFLVEVVSTF